MAIHSRSSHVSGRKKLMHIELAFSNDIEKLFQQQIPSCYCNLSESLNNIKTPAIQTRSKTVSVKMCVRIRSVMGFISLLRRVSKEVNSIYLKTELTKVRRKLGLWKSQSQKKLSTFVFFHMKVLTSNNGKKQFYSRSIKCKTLGSKLLEIYTYRDNWSYITNYSSLQSKVLWNFVS